jgi:hypothetical protein
VIDIENFEIPFEVPFDGRMKEITIPITATWHDAQIAISRVLICTAERLDLGYINPFKNANASKVPLSLDKEDEWAKLIHHVKVFLKAHNAKKNGKGVPMKEWNIALVDFKQKDKSSKVRIHQLIVAF